MIGGREIAPAFILWRVPRSNILVRDEVSIY